MERMKTFFLYVLMIVAFYLFSNLASDLLILNSYNNVESNNIKISETNNGFTINIKDASSNKRQAYFTGTVKNNSDKVIQRQNVRVNSYYKGELMQSKYLVFENMQPGEERSFKLKYSVGNIDEYKVDYVDEIPVNKTVIDDAIKSASDFITGIKTKGILNEAKSKFTPVSVEGSNLELFIAVMWVIYAIPSGAIWFIL